MDSLIVVFGATGDLVQRKIMPALYKLHRKGQLPNIPIIFTSRRPLSSEQYREILKVDALDTNKERLASFLNKVEYVSLDTEKEHGKKLGDYIKKHPAYAQVKGNVIFYLSIAPSLVSSTLEKIEESGLLKDKGNKKLVIEKPFGTNEGSAIALNSKLKKLFNEKDIYRVDHYLGKALVSNILALRFANPFFESIWNNKFIDNVQVTLAEFVGVEGRGEYYEQTGVVRDMVQNHVLQLLSLIAMESPKTLKADDIRTEKVKIIRALQEINPKEMVVGQYGSGIREGKRVLAYKEEQFVHPTSTTPTFIAFKTHVKTQRWKGVPFYIRTGKRLTEKYTEINLVLKEEANPLFKSVLRLKETNQPNAISIRIEPQEGVVMQFRAMDPARKHELYPVSMEFCHNCEFGASTPEAYETVIREIIHEDQTMFARWDEMHESWKCTDKILKKVNGAHKNLAHYETGSMGPTASDDLLKKDKKSWIYIPRKLTL